MRKILIELRQNEAAETPDGDKRRLHVVGDDSHGFPNGCKVLGLPGALLIPPLCHDHSSQNEGRQIIHQDSQHSVEIGGGKPLPMHDKIGKK